LTTTELIYQQAIENEQSESLTSEEREQYIASLIGQGETEKTIASILGKSIQWIYAARNAAKFREQYGEKFDQAGTSLTTENIRLLAGISDEKIYGIIDSLDKNPGKKTEILKAARKAKPKKIKKGLTPKPGFDQALSSEPDTEKIPPNDNSMTRKQAIFQNYENPSAIDSQMEKDPKYKCYNIEVKAFANDEDKQFKLFVYFLNGTEDTQFAQIIRDAAHYYFIGKDFNVVSEDNFSTPI
jgi:DNA-binding CsgD family transcriptional regulator